jgi:hypothetical protein
MKHKIIAGVGMLLLIPILASAQGHVPALVADINFSFHAGDKVLPAGSYEFAQKLGAEVITLVNMKTRESVMIPIVTRISPRSPNDSLLVFDKTQDQNYLSELYFPGEDGYQVAGATGPHSHVNVKARK